MNVTSATDLIERNAEKLGYGVYVSWAQTGSRYLTCTRDDAQVIVRVADHGECYCREDITVDPDGCEPWQAVRLLAEKAGQPEPAWIRGLLTRRANAEKARKARSATVDQQRRAEKAAVREQSAAYAKAHPELADRFAAAILPGGANRSRRGRARRAILKRTGLPWMDWEAMAALAKAKGE